MGTPMNAWFLNSDQREGMTAKPTGLLSWSSSEHRNKTLSTCLSWVLVLSFCYFSFLHDDGDDYYCYCYYYY